MLKMRSFCIVGHYIYTDRLYIDYTYVANLPGLFVLVACLKFKNIRKFPS